MLKAAQDAAPGFPAPTSQEQTSPRPALAWAGCI